MQRNVRPWVTTGIVIAGASLIAVTPVGAPQPDVQHRQLRLVDYTEYDASQLTSATDTNLSGLESVLSSSNWTTDPDISQGLSTLFSDLSTGASNPVTNPISLLSEGALGLLSGNDAANAASTALTAVTDNVESALSSGDTSTALTDLENGGTTVAYAFLNGYPDAVGSGNDISPEFGLLTNTADGAATGQIDSLAQLSNTVADEVSALGGGDLTTSPTVLGPGSLDLSVNLDSLLNTLGSGGNLTLPISLDSLLSDVAPSGTLTLPVSLDGLLNDAAPSGTLTLPVSLDGLLNDAAPSGTLTLPFSLNDLLSGATSGGNLTLPVSLDGLLQDVTGGPTGSLTIPVSLDSLLNDAAGGSGGDLTIPVTPDAILTDVLGGGGSISIPSISLSSILPADFSVTLPRECISFLGCVGGNTISIPDPAYHDTITPPSISDATVLSDLESVLGSSGNTDISIPVASLESLLGTTGSSDLSVSTSTLEGLLGTFGSNDISVSTSTLEGLLGTSGSNDISLSVSDLQTLLGATGSSDLSVSTSTLEGLFGGAGSNDISLPISTLESLFGSSGSTDISIPLSTLEGILPSNLNLDLPIPEVTGAAVPNFEVDLSHDLLAALGSITPVASDLPSLLGTDPTLDATSLLSSALTDLGLPVSVTGGDLPVNLTGIGAELLSGLVP
ncbi:hypothetical protein [Mycobacterium sp.]|uniref:hypothetical protein n=1 Tax=Mycobacterium sp. TaxID=1785 RepID=UPI0031D70E6A